MVETGTEGEDGVELLVVEIRVGEKPVRIITGYGPQETAGSEAINNFYVKLEEGCHVGIPCDSIASLCRRFHEYFSLHC